MKKNAIMSLVGLAILSGMTTYQQTEKSAEDSYSNFIELRIYKSKDKMRDKFLDYFEEHFVESQEVVDMRIWGEFKDLNTPTHFVWLRGYQSMAKRKEGLRNFYSSSVWNEYAPAVGDMLVAADHVHFLEPVSFDSGFDPNLKRQLISIPPHGDSNWDENSGVVVAQLYLLEGDEPSSDLVEKLNSSIVPFYATRGANTLGLFESSDEENNIPRLPFIEDERVVAWFASYESQQAYEKAQKALDEQDNSKSLLKPFETFVLKPGKRARLYHRTDQ